jgi:outer membrane protein assembly factor BamB
MKLTKKLTLFLLLIGASLLLSGCTRASSLMNASSWPGLSVDDSTVYIAYGPSVLAIQDGKLLWRYPAEPDRNLAFFANPLVYGDTVYAGSYNNQLHLLNKDNGSLISTVVLSATKNKIISAPTVLEDTLLIPSSDATIYAFDPTNMTTPKWKIRLSNEIWSSPIEVGDEIYVFSLDKQLNVLNAETGALIRKMPVTGAVMGDMILHDNKLYFSTLAKQVSYYDIEKQEIVKLFDTDGEIWASPLIDDDRIIVADMLGNIYCNNIETGLSNWKIPASSQNVGIIATPVMLGDGNYLFAAEDGTLMLYDLDGKSVNTRATGSKILTTPHIQGDSVIVAFIPGEALLKSYSFDLKENWVYVEAVAAETAQTTEAAVQVTATPKK